MPPQRFHATEIEPVTSFASARRNDTRIKATAQTVILLVEDNPSDVLLIHEALAQHGVRPRMFVAKDGDEAIDLLDQIDDSTLLCPELVILDVNLPKKPGFDVLSRIRESPKCGAVPVVVLTSSNAPSDRREAERLGATMYLVKPSNLE